MDDQEIARTYNCIVLQGKLCQAVRWITQRHKGGVLYPDEIDIKTGRPVIDVLKSRHPEARVLDVGDLPHYDETPNFFDVDITADTVESVARGPGGKTNATLWEAVTDFMRWMTNEMPPWASYEAMIASPCVALDKCPGVRPLPEKRQRMHASSIKLAQDIEGSIHAIHELWGEHDEEDEWGFLLVDATNAFNEGNHIMILWTVHHEWPSGARFTFTCYGHWGTLRVRNQNGTALFIFSMEGATQGDPLAMFIHGMGLLLLIRRLKSEVDDVSQPWFADDAGAGGKFD
eukprot:scaffold85322_cov36-Attheya_sp.AAC.1